MHAIISTTSYSRVVRVMSDLLWQWDRTHHDGYVLLTTHTPSGVWEVSIDDLEVIVDSPDQAMSAGASLIDMSHMDECDLRAHIEHFLSESLGASCPSM